MPIKDAVTKEFLQSKEIFADLFNFLLYDGNPVISPDRLHEINPELIYTTGDDPDNNSSVTKIRDLLMYLTAMEDDNFAYLLLGIENQSTVDHDMPIRNFVYDALQYDRQKKEATRLHKKNEYIPVITLVIYWSPGKWTGPKSLHEMFSIKDKEVLSFVTDYKMNLLVPGEVDDNDLDKLKTSLRNVFKYIKCSQDKILLQKLIHEDEQYQHLDRKATQVINVITDSKLPISEEEEEINMCKAIDDIREEARQEEYKKRIEQLKQIAQSLFMAKMSIPDIAKIIEIEEFQVRLWLETMA